MKIFGIQIGGGDEEWQPTLTTSELEAIQAQEDWRRNVGEIVLSRHLRDGVSLDRLTPLDNGDVEMATTLEDGTETTYIIAAGDVATIWRLASRERN